MNKKAPPEYVTGPEAVQRFEDVVGKVLSTPPPRQKPKRRGRPPKRPQAAKASRAEGTPASPASATENRKKVAKLRG